LDEKLLEIIKYAVALIVLVMVFFGGTFVLRSVMGTEYPVMVVVSQSMIPTLGVGDFILVGEIPSFETVNAAPPPNGDVLVFQRSSIQDEYIVHRAIEKYLNDGGWSFLTKGDNNLFPDGAPVPENRVIGKVVGRVPILGYFSLFIKTISGFIMVIGLMLIAFYFDNILPEKDVLGKEGRFPYLALIPMLIPIFTVSLLNNTERNLTLDIVAIASWYISCIVLPLSIWDDDTGLMVWLYHLVLIMIPTVCDIVWWTTRITPSMWWYGEKSTIPLTWLLMKETPTFRRAFRIIVGLLLPGCVAFLGLLTFKRNNNPLVKNISYRIRGVTEKEKLVELPA
jgi:signal peptidase